MAVTNKELANGLAAISKGLEAFIAQYNEDMRGNTRLGNGEKGVIGELREIKEYQHRFPSLTWLLAHRPIPTVSVGLGLWIFIMVLYTLGILKLVGPLIGIDIPMVTPMP